MCLLSNTISRDKAGSDYEICFSAWGSGVLSDAALLEVQKPDNVIKEFKKKYRRYPKSISLLLEDSLSFGNDYGFTGVSSQFLSKLRTLKELVLPDSVTDIELTPELHEVLKENKTLIRGSFGSFAQRFARENSLHFRPADLIFAEYCFEPARESTRMILRFARNGNVTIREVITAPGTNAGNTSGGSFYHSLKRDFFKTQSAEQIAQRFSPQLCRAILDDGRLADFLAKAREQGYFTGSN